MGGVLCRPLSRHRCRDQSRKLWRERPRCARWKWPRACPEGSLTPWLSVSVSVLGIAPASFTKAVTCAAGVVPESGPLSSGQSGPVRAGNLGPRAAPFPHVMTRPRFGVCVACNRCSFEVSDVSTIRASLETSAITQLMFDLCLAPCKARRFAPPAHARGLRALTAPAPRSCLGHYVMAGGVMTLSWTDLGR